MINDKAILRRLAGITELPTLPEVMQEVLTAVASDDSSAKDLAAILSTDQALCAKVLKIANSAFFAQRRRICDMDEAIVVLGFDSIVQIMLATAVFKVFSSMPIKTTLDVYGFWRHSIATAVAGKMITEKIGKREQDKVVYTAGLLHDVGKLVLIRYFSDSYAAVFEKLQTEDMFLHEAEVSTLGFTHCDIGEWLCNRWNFPAKLVLPIARHHDVFSQESAADLATSIIRLANIFCNRLDIGNSGNKKPYFLNLEECQAVGLQDDDIEKIELKLEENREGIEMILRAIT
jgi:putative nucleotidyltransferase with HDIG domain